MRVRVQKVGHSDRPRGVVVEVITAMGPLQLVVGDDEVQKDTVEVGYPLRRDNDLVFVALPRPTLTGSFRVWVRAEDVFPNTAFA
jgi:hypothetical protein